MKALTTLLALAAATTQFAPATAQATSSHTEVVTYADLDLTRPDGVRALDRRLRTAVEKACGPVSSADPAGRQAVRSCRAALRGELAQRRADVLAGAARRNVILVSLER